MDMVAVSSDIVCEIQGRMLINQNQGQYSGCAILVRNQDGHLKRRLWKSRPERDTGGTEWEQIFSGAH